MSKGKKNKGLTEVGGRPDTGLSIEPVNDVSSVIIPFI